MKIRVIGTGCATCKKLHYLTGQAAKELGIDPSQVEYSTNIQEIIEMGLMSSPVLTIDGEPQRLKSHSVETIKELINQASDKAK